MKIFTGETEELRILAILTEAKKENAIILCDKNDSKKFIDSAYTMGIQVNIRRFSLEGLAQLEEQGTKYIVDKFELLFPIALSKMIGYGTIYAHDFNKKGDMNVS